MTGYQDDRHGRTGLGPGLWAGLGFVLLGGLAINGQLLGVFVDDAIYLDSGRHLWRTGEYRIPFLPGAPLAGKYPPLFPIVLGGLSHLVPPPPEGLWHIKFISLLLWLPGFVCLGGLLSEELGAAHRGRYPLLVLSALSGSMLSIAVEVMSEGLFFSLCLATLLCLARARRSTSTDAGIGRLQWAAMALAVCAWHTRGVGLCLCAAVAIELGRSRPLRGLIALAAMWAVRLPFTLWRDGNLADEPLMAAVPYLLSYDYHLDGLIGFLGDGGDPAAYLGTSVRAAVLGLGGALVPAPLHPSLVDAVGAAPGAVPPWVHAGAWAVAVVVVLGAVPALRGRRTYAWFAVFYAVVVSLWPWFNKVRFFAALLPLWLLFGLEGLSVLGAGLSRIQTATERALRPSLPSLSERPPLLALVVCVVLLASQVAYYAHLFGASDLSTAIAGHPTAGRTDTVERASAWLRVHTRPSAVLVSSVAGPLFAMHSGRQVLPYLMGLFSGAEHIAMAVSPGDLAGPSIDLAQFLDRARPALAGRELWHVALCQAGCPAETLAGRVPAVFSDGVDGGPAIVISRLPTLLQSTSALDTR